MLKLPRWLRRPPPDGAGEAATRLGSFTPVFAAPQLDAEEQMIVDRFADLYYSKLDQGRGLHTIVLSWMGHEMFKCPMDLWIYQEVITMQRPDLIIEIGTYKGGSTLYLAHVCDLVGVGEVVSVDIDDRLQPERPVHPRIRYIKGSSTDPGVVEQLRAIVAGRANVLVILDGNHERDHVLEELRIYQAFIPPGGLLIAEDTNVNGHPTFPEHGPGPWEAVDAFLAETPDFVADRTCERFLLTMNPRGYLRRVAPAA